MKFINTVPEEKQEVIKVIGVGGAGTNAVNHMAKNNKGNVIYICANTDIKHLNSLDVEHKITMGLKNTTKGLGTGMNVHLGKEAALESEEEITQAIIGSDMIFIAAGMGGGTGTGSAPVVAGIAKSLNILSVAVVAKPFSTEGKKKMRIAEEGILSLVNKVDSLIVLPNDRLADTLPKEILNDMDKTLACSDEVLSNSVTAITDIIGTISRMNIDFADIKRVMSMPGKAMISVGEAVGEDRAIYATQDALKNPLIEDMDLKNAKGVIANIVSGSVGQIDYGDVLTTLEEYANDDADIKVGYVLEPELGELMRVTVILTGLDNPNNINHYDNNITQEDKHSIIDQNADVTLVKHNHNTMKALTSMPRGKTDIRQVPAYLRNKQQA